MVSPLLLLGAGAAVVAASGPKKKPEKELEPGVPDNAKTRAYSQAVHLVELVKRGHKSGGQFFNGIVRGSAPAKGLPVAPILTQKDLPATPAGWIWSEVREERRSLSAGVAPLRTFWRLSYQGSEQLPEDIRRAVPEKPTFMPATPLIPAAGYSELIEKMKEGTFYVPPDHTEVADIQF